MSEATSDITTSANVNLKHALDLALIVQLPGVPVAQFFGSAVGKLHKQRSFAPVASERQHRHLPVMQQSLRFTTRPEGCLTRYSGRGCIVRSLTETPKL